MTAEREIELFKKLDEINLYINHTDAKIASLITIFKELNIDKRFQHLEDKVLNLESRIILLERSKDG